MDITFGLGNLISFVDNLNAGLNFDFAALIDAIASGSGSLGDLGGSLGGAPELPVTQ